MNEFAPQGAHAEVAVLIVTYQSAAEIGTLLDSLRAEAADQSLRVVVVDNASADGTLDVVSAHPDVVAVSSGGNLGYAGGVNVGIDHAGDADALLVLNPDLTVHRGCIAALRERMRRERGGVVVPRILASDDSLYPSLRNEPSIARALGDAVFGGRARPARVPGEIISDPATYTSPRTVDWATGAALLIDGRVADAVGHWDERFFLYSEETDFFRRVRDLGHEVWYEPSAVVSHAQGGSGSSSDLERLMAVNRIRYARKHMGPARARAFRGAVVLHELARSYDPRHRAVLRTVLSERSWADLPHGSGATS